MPQSTPITELQRSPDPSVNQTQAGSTQPLVQDILKEIQQENGNSQVQTNAGIQSVQLNEHTLEAPPNMTELGTDEYNAQQEQALQYQMDPSIQPQIDHTLEAQQQDPSGMMQQELMPMDDLTVEYPQKQVSTAQRALEQLKDPLLVVLLSILLSVPSVSGFILQQVSKIPGTGNQMVPILVRAVLAGILFYGLRKFV